MDSLENPDKCIPDEIVQTEGETKVIIGLTDIYWENIAGIAGKPHTMPINFTFMRTLESSVLKRVYKLLALAFQTMERTEYKGKSASTTTTKNYVGEHQLRRGRKGIKRKDTYNDI